MYAMWLRVMRKKFVLPRTPATTQKNIRFPNDMITEVESVIKGTECSFSQFVIAATRLALDDLEEEEACQLARTEEVIL